MISPWIFTEFTKKLAGMAVVCPWVNGNKTQPFTTWSMTLHSIEAVCHSVNFKGFEAGLGFILSHNSCHTGSVVWTSCFQVLGSTAVKWRYKYTYLNELHEDEWDNVYKGQPHGIYSGNIDGTKLWPDSISGKLWLNSRHHWGLLFSLPWPTTETPIAHFEEVILNAIMPYPFIPEVLKTRY